MFASITDFQMIMMFIFNIVSTNNSKPNESDTHNSKERNKMFNFLSISRFKAKTIRFLRFKNRFNRTKAIRVISNSTRRIVIGNKKPRVIRVRVIRANDSSFKKTISKKNILKRFRRIFTRFNIKKIRSAKEALRVGEGIGQRRFRANAEETINRLNKR